MVAQERLPNPPQIIEASNEGQTAISEFKFPVGIQCELFAAEPDVANIVALHRDYQGRLFACETFRQEKGVEDNRRHGHWMKEELQAQTVQDRIDYIRKYIPDADQIYTAQDDRIRRLVDSDGDGKADQSTVFSDHYNQLEMGTGAGVLSYRDKVYYTCIPDLFELVDVDGDGVADERRSLHSGFGVRFAFRGHDMHGLIVGPDGRLYFSIGDRGYNVSPQIKDPTSGAVFRCELDGSNLEVVCTGLRNPQELAFDDFGNLFTGDNNSDSGDMARWVYLVPGSDSGWRMYYQYLADRGPFNRERIWHPYDNDSPAYIVPPVANISDGPSGLEYYPGTGFGDDFNGRFFLCDFRGNATTSGVRSFRVQQNGAGWTLTDQEQPFWNMLVTDLDFGSDGKLYVSDWVFGWNGENKGRIYAFSDSERIDSAIVMQVESLLRNGLADQTTADLKTLLEHADQRVRQEAQFELVGRNEVTALQAVALDGTDRRARVHAIWGLGQIARRELSPKQVSTAPAIEWPGFIRQLVKDQDFEVRAQAAQLAAESLAVEPAVILPLLKDENLRVRFYAAMALSKLGDATCVAPVAEMLADNADADPIVRHGGIMALKHLLSSDAGSNANEAALKTAQHNSHSVRLALVIAIRKALTDRNGGFDAAGLTESLGQMLQDSDPKVFVETVRVIHDVPVNPLMPQLASQITKVQSRMTGGIDDDAILRRLINANFRVGEKPNAVALAGLAADKSYDIERRMEALKGLGNWMNPPAEDQVLNDWRPVPTANRNLEDAQLALKSNYAAYIADVEAVASEAIRAAGTLEIKDIGEALQNVVLSTDFSAATRAAALASLQQVAADRVDAVCEKMTEQFDQLPGELASLVSTSVAAKQPGEGIELFARLLGRSGERETSAKQSVIAALGEMTDADSLKFLSGLLEGVENGEGPDELSLDIVLAAEARGDSELRSRLKEFRGKLAANADPSMNYILSTHGGDEEAGKKVFFGKTEVSCVRCHRIDGNGGRVGPDLSGVAVKNDRKYLLDSIVKPSQDIAPGFAQEKIQTIDGLMYVGIVKSESDSQLQLLDADGNLVLIDPDDIEGRKPGLSGMPDDLIKQLSEVELRDLIEYLARRRAPLKTPAGTNHETP